VKLNDGKLGGVKKHRFSFCKADDLVRKCELVTKVIALYSDLNRAKVPLPTFTAGNLERILKFAPNAMDTCSLTTNVATLQNQMLVMQKRMDLFHAATSEAYGNNSPDCHESKSSFDLAGDGVADGVGIGIHGNTGKRSSSGMQVKVLRATPASQMSSAEAHVKDADT